MSIVTRLQDAGETADAIEEVVLRIAHATAAEVAGVEQRLAGVSNGDLLRLVKEFLPAPETSTVGTSDATKSLTADVETERDTAVVGDRLKTVADGTSEPAQDTPATTPSLNPAEVGTETGALPVVRDDYPKSSEYPGTPNPTKEQVTPGGTGVSAASTADK